MSSRKLLWIILLFAFVMRAGWFLVVQSQNPEGIWSFDSHGYWQLAENMVEHQTFSRSESTPLIPDTFRTPGYPLFLSIFIYLGGKGSVVVFFQIILSVLSCYFLYKSGKEINDEKTGLIASALYAVNIPSILFSNSLLSETLFLFLLIISIYYLIKHFKSQSKLDLFLSALFTGSVMLCRPAALFLPLLILLTLIIFYRKALHISLKTSAIYLIVVMITISPWIYRNYASFDQFFFSTSGQFNITSFHAANIYSKKHDLPIHEAQKKLWSELYEQYDGIPEKEQITYSKFISEKSVDIFLEHPLLFFQQQGKAIFNLLFKPLRGDIDHQLGITGKYNSIASDNNTSVQNLLDKLVASSSGLTIALSFYQLFYLAVIYLLCIPGTYSLWRTNKTHLFFLLLLIFYFVNLTLPPTTYARYRMPAIPFFLLLCSSGVGFLTKKASRTIS